VGKGLELLSHFSQDLAENRYKRAADLPQADRRKLEICRALAPASKLLLLDEPSGHVTEETQELMEDIWKVEKDAGNWD
jgi:branched-chain amino acid transport system ATP-binding protein